jgi:hypothetical protein
MPVRVIRENLNSVHLPKHVDDAVDIGDLLFWDSDTQTVRPAHKVSGADYVTKAANFAVTFVGVALTAEEANRAGTIVVATSGDAVFIGPTGPDTDYQPLDYVMVGDGVDVHPQKVVRAIDESLAIGRVIHPKSSGSTETVIRILSKFNR